MMLDVKKEIDEIRLDYYIRNNAQNRLIELSLSDVSTILCITKTKAQRLVDKLIKLGILEIITKGNSRTSKTIYKYTDKYTVHDTVKHGESNAIENCNNTVSDTDKIIDLFKVNFGMNQWVRNELLNCCKGLEFEVFEQVVFETNNNTTIRSKNGYILTTLHDMYDKNVKSINDYKRYKKNYKTKIENNSKRKNWNYSEKIEEDVDLEVLAKLTRHR